MTFFPAGVQFTDPSEAAELAKKVAKFNSDREHDAFWLAVQDMRQPAPAPRRTDSDCVRRLTSRLRQGAGVSPLKRRRLR